MTDSIELVDTNPVLVVKQIVEAVQQGYYANNSIEGYPSLNTFPARIRLFKTDKPAKRISVVETTDKVTLENYEQVNWVLDIQDVALQGFDVLVDSISVGNLMSCTMSRAKAIVEPPKAVKTDATPEVTQDVAPEVVDKPTPEVAPKTTRKKKGAK